MNPDFILASSSPFRQQILKKIIPEFATFSPDIDESPLPGESAHDLVQRLALEKAKTAIGKFEQGIVIGSDQVALHNEQILGKPHTVENAHKQLTQFSGSKVTFLTSLALLDIANERHQVIVEPFEVHFKTLTSTQISQYVAAESPLKCAGSFKSEGLGICLFEALKGDDPNTLIGLPLIRLNQLLLNWDIDPLALQQVD